MSGGCTEIEEITIIRKETKWTYNKFANSLPSLLQENNNFFAFPDKLGHFKVWK